MVQPAERLPGSPPPAAETQFTDVQQERRRALICDFATAQGVKIEAHEITPPEIDAEFANFAAYFAAAQREMKAALKPSALRAARTILDAVCAGDSRAHIAQDKLGIRPDEYDGQESLLLSMLVKGKKLVEQQKLQPKPPASSAASRPRTGPSRAWNGGGTRRVSGLAGTVWNDNAQPGFTKEGGVAKQSQRPQRKQLSNADLGPQITALFGADSDEAYVLRMHFGVDETPLRNGKIAEELGIPLEQVKRIIDEATPKLLGEDPSGQRKRK